MSKPNDSNLTPEQHLRIRKEAHVALKRADALGRFPTPVDDILAANKVMVEPEDVLDEGFLRKFAHGIVGRIKKAWSKVVGVLDAVRRVIILDRTVPIPKQPFLKLHETGHAVLPWQSQLYAGIEESNKTIAPEISDLFDREANAFASEVLFQLDAFTAEAKDHPFELRTPMRLSKKYGASVYSAIRRYVSLSDRACAVLVLEPPVLCPPDGFVARLRRWECSSAFTQQFGDGGWPEEFSPDDRIGKLVPLGERRMSAPRTIQLQDTNGDEHECIAEAFTNTHQVFILIYAVRSLKARRIILPAS